MNESDPATIELATLTMLMAGGFAATNLDNLLIMVGMLGASRRRQAALLVGYMAAAASVLALALLGTLLGNIVGARHIGMLGIVPVAMGLYLLYRVLTGTGESAPAGHGRADAGELGAGLNMYLLMLSNSGDSVVLFVPLFAESSREALAMEVLVFLLMIAVWVVLARLVVGHRGISGVLERHGPYIVPIIMIAVGGYILMDTATDTLQ